MNRKNSLTSRLELGPSRTAQVKDAAPAMKRAYGSVRERNAGARTPRWVVLGAALLGLLVPAANAASAQAAAPAWKLTVTPNADYFLSPTLADPQASTEHPGVYILEAENVGDAATAAEPITVQDILPAGLSAIKVHFYLPGGAEQHEALCPSLLKCKYPVTSPPIAPGQKLVMAVLATVPSGLEGPLHDFARVSGGAPSAEAGATNAASAEPPFGIMRFHAALSDSSKVTPYSQAGGHPFQFVTEIDYETYSAPVLQSSVFERESWDVTGSSPMGDPRATVVDLPPGLLANPQAVPHCELADYFISACSRSRDVVGSIDIGQGVGFAFNEPVYNLQPTGAYPGELGFTALNLPFGLITAGLRSGSDYGVRATALAPQADISRIRLNLWGVPAEEAHNAMRGKGLCGSGRFRSGEESERACEITPQPGREDPAGYPPAAFLTMPSECSGQPLSIAARYDTWQLPGVFAEASSESPALEGCNQLGFEPSIEARPTTNLADAPSGFDFDLEVPQHEACTEPPLVGCEPATPELREALVKLPAGLTVNPSSGAGLEGCSPSQIGLTTAVGQTPAHFTEEPAHCPEAAKLGNVEVKTPLLHEPLGAIEPTPGRVGAVYLATPHQNPSGNLLAGYIVLEGEGIIVKLAGRFQADPQTGQITASFLENPQLPFEEFKFHFFEGARGALRTPAVCGTYEVHSTLTPYSAPESGPPAEPTSEFTTTTGSSGEGSRCPNAPFEEPHAPRFSAGTESSQAAIYSPFGLRLVRDDGSQELKAIDTTLPPGLVGKLAGVGECSDAALTAAADPHHTGAAEQASPSCPSSSEVGTVDVAAGAGPTPLNVPGKAYLAGPYKSAPLSLAIITPAVAGPFDLGTVVVRTALYVNSETAQIHAVSDEIPHILEGIPLDVRSVTLKMARPNFTLNPTNCEPLAFTGSALSVFGQSAPLSQRFQVGGCNALKFKPRLALSLKGATKRHTFPALKAVVTYPQKGAYANIAKAQVTLPHSSFLEQSHIKTVCTRPQLASQTCPAASIYGHATAVTPLLDKPLSGPVYLGVGFGHELPDLVAELDGQIRVLLDGKVDTGKEHGLRNSFELVPDAPVSKFTLEMSGGKKGLIVNSENLCSPHAKVKAVADFTGQNGKTYDTEPTVANSCGKKGKKKSKGKGKHPSHRVGTSHR